MLYPFVPQCVYIPILPAHLIEYLEAPTPYIMGIHESLQNLNMLHEEELTDVFFFFFFFFFFSPLPLHFLPLSNRSVSLSSL